MTTRVLIVDYNDRRRQQLKDLIKARFKDYEVDELATSPPDPTRDTDAGKLSQVRVGHHDLFIGHIGGNPSGYECLKVFKDHNPKGKAVLYTKQESIDLKALDGLKLADKVFRRSDNDNKLFDNADEMLDVIHAVVKESSVVYWKNPFRDLRVLTAIVTLVTAILGLIAALLKGST